MVMVISEYLQYFNDITNSKTLANVTLNLGIKMLK